MATWYIASTSHPTTPGNDSNAGTSSALPKATIAAVHTAATSGDTVICKASTGTIVWASQTFTKNLTIQGESMPVYDPITKNWTGAIFNGAAGDISWSGSVTLTITDLIFTNVTNTTANLTGCVSQTTLTCRRCIFHTMTTPGFVNTSQMWGGILRATTLTVHSCIFYSITGTIFATNHQATYSIYHNKIYTAISTLIFNGRSSNAETVTIDYKNNVAVNAGVSVAFNTIAGSTTHTFTFSYNCTYGTWTAIPSGSNNITSDPLFVDAANGDFSLRPGSPCINTGVAL